MKNKIRVLFLGSFPNKDQPYRGIFNLRAVELLSKEVSLYGISIRTWRPGRRLIEEEDHLKYKIWHLCIPYYPSNVRLLHALSVLLVVRFISFLMKERIKECELVHSISGGYGIFGAPLSRRFHIPHLLQLTGSDVYSTFSQYAHLKYIKSIPGNTELVIGNSKLLVPAFNELFNTSYKNRFVYRGIDLRHFEYKKPVSGLTLLYLGGLDDYKGIKHGMNTKGGITLMKAWESIEDQCNMLQAKLFFGGSNSECEVFRKWHNDLKFPESVSLIGCLTPQMVGHQLSLASVVIIPSMEEGLPNLAVESIATGRPVICSNVGGLPEVIENKKSGWIFPAGDSNILSQLIVEVLRQPEKITEFGLAARDRAEHLFDQQNFVRSYTSFYFQLCAE
jgi:glycosyltransferase involved in cell wall biosynthesis